jgi:hypothetical protein
MRFLVLLVLAWLACTARAADAPAVEEGIVTVWSRPVSVFRTSFLGVSPVERARRAQRAISEAVAAGGPGEVTVQQEPQGRVVLVDGSMVLILTPQDADALRGETLEKATRATVAALSRVIEETRESRDRGRLLRAALYALLATALYALAVSLVIWVRRKLFARAEAWVHVAAEHVAMGRSPLFWHGAGL